MRFLILSWLSFSMVAAAPVAPEQLLAKRVQGVLSELKSRPIVPTNSLVPIEIATRPDKNSFIASVYENKLVDSTKATEMLSDKRVLAEVLNRELGVESTGFYPKTLGLREFLFSHHLLDSKGQISQDGDTIEQALHDEFPSGFVVRPAVGVAPTETSHGLFKDGDAFVVELLKPNSSLYQPSHFTKPVTSHILGRVSSGEAVVIQEDVVGTADVKHPLKHRFFEEVRIHTYENRVVENAVPSRWVQTQTLTADEITKAEAFVSKLLAKLPLALTNRQAWGVDVAVMDNGEMRIIDVVTNRGEKIAWSSYLDQPRVIAAYAKHFEQHAGVHFAGLSGTLIRNGFANYFAFWGKRIEKAHGGVGKILAYLPPVP